MSRQSADLGGRYFERRSDTVELTSEPNKCAVAIVADASDNRRYPALEHPVLHVLEHLTFAVGGLLYWWHLLSPIRARHRLGGLGPVAYMLSTKLAVGLLGIVLTFSPEALYDFYAHQPRRWGLSPLTDQSLGGALMALEQTLVMGTALVALFIRQLGEAEREQQRAERYGAA